MEGISVDFVSKFYNLEGNLVGERKKNFSLLLRELSSFSDFHIVDHFITNVQPRNYLEKLFKIDAMIYFKKTSELLKVVKDNNEVFVSKIFKHQWFFEDAFESFDVETLVSDFIPHLSFSNRQKFLKRIFVVLDKDQIDRLFSAIYTRYGLWFARKFLHFCSEEKIRDVFNKEKVHLESSQVKYLFVRNENSFLNYLDYYKKTFHDTYKNLNVLKYIGHKKLELLLILINDNKVAQIKLGKRTSKKAFQIVKNDIPNNFDKYIKELNNNIVFRRLGNHFKNMYQNRLPSNFSDLNVNYEFQILKSLPKSTRWTIFTNSFFMRYPNHIVTELTFSDILSYCPDRSFIKKRAEIAYKKTQDNNYLKYIDLSKSIPLIKEKINVTSDIHSRRNLVTLLIESCSENKNLNMLKSVLKYICDRHRNEDAYFHQHILTTVKDNFNLQQFNEIHWNCINEQIRILKIREEFHMWQFRQLCNRYLEFLIYNKKDFKVVLKEYLDDVLKTSSLHYTLHLNNPEIERTILIEMYKYSDTGYITECEPTGNHNYRDIIAAIVQFNKDNPEYFISIEDFKVVTEYVSSLFEKTSNFNTNDCVVIDDIIIYKSKYPQSFSNINESAILNIFLHIYAEKDTQGINNSLGRYILKKQRNNLENDVMIAYFEQFIELNPHIDIISWFLKNEPQTIVPYFHNIMSVIDRTSVDIKLCKFYSHFNFDEQLIEHFKLKLQSDQTDNKDEYVKKIKILLTTDEFIKIVNQFLPEKEKVDLENKKMMKVYQIQCNVAKMLHHVLEPHKMLPTVMKFCKGDYLQSTLRALYSIFYRSPERLLQSYVDIIVTRAASIRKHAVFLTCEVLDQTHATNILTTTQHYSISSQKHLFSATLKYFQKNPSETSLNLVIRNMSTIDKYDQECLESLVNSYKSIFQKYKVPYVEKCWSFFEDLEQQEVKINQYLTQLLSALTEDPDILRTVSTSFVKHILNNYLGSNKLHNIMDFAASTLIHREHDQIEHFELVFNKNSTMNKKQLQQFFRGFICRNVDIQFVNLLNKYWNENFNKVHTFWEHMYLNLWILHLTNSSPDSFAQDVVTYLDKIVTEFGFYSHNIFEDVFKDFLFHQYETYKYQLLEKILLIQQTPGICILILNILIPVDSKDCAPTFKNILKIIKNVKDPLVIIFYKKYVSDHDLE